MKWWWNRAFSRVLRNFRAIHKSVSWPVGDLGHILFALQAVMSLSQKTCGLPLARREHGLGLCRFCRTNKICHCFQDVALLIGLSPKLTIKIIKNFIKNHHILRYFPGTSNIFCEVRMNYQHLNCNIKFFIHDSFVWIQNIINGKYLQAYWIFKFDSKFLKGSIQKYIFDTIFPVNGNHDHCS